MKKCTCASGLQSQTKAYTYNYLCHKAINAKVPKKEEILAFGTHFIACLLFKKQLDMLQNFLTDSVSVRMLSLNIFFIAAHPPSSPLPFIHILRNIWP